MACLTDGACVTTDGATAGQTVAVAALAAFAELARMDLATTTFAAALSRVAELAKAVIPGVGEASVRLLPAGGAGAAASTGELARLLDEWQYGSGQGPSVDAAAGRAVQIVAETTTETRWPAFATEARRQGVRSVLAVGMPIREAVAGGLSLYSVRPASFDEASVEAALTFAGYAGVALANAHLYETTAALAEQMADAMATRAVIEQAKGVLVAQRAVSPQEAFEILSRASQNGNRKLRDIAQAIVDGAYRPG